MTLESLSITGSLEEFFDTLYRDMEGFAYIATKNPNTLQPVWKQFWYKWPTQREELLQGVRSKYKDREVYFGPALYVEPEHATKDYILGSHCFWCEFDGNAPETVNDLPEPSVVIQSSSERHQHWYWLSEEQLDPEEIELVNCTIAYAFGSDTSGWDVTQVLRPPETYNHKRSKGVTLRRLNKTFFTVKDFAHLDPPPPRLEIELPEKFPATEDVVAKYQFDAKTWTIFKSAPKIGERSDRLMELGYRLAEMNVKDDEILVLLLNADARWGKFAGRNDQLRRLTQIVSVARSKYPFKETETTDKWSTHGLLTLFSSNIKLEWIWEGLLQERGYFLLTGPAGIGKSQFSFDFAVRSCLNETFLERKIRENLRIGLVSLEMGHADLKYFLQQQTRERTQEELEKLEGCLRILPMGEPLYLSTTGTRDRFEQWIYDEKLDGIIIDSLGSTTEGELSQEVDVKKLMDWNDRIRQRHGCFTWFVHHHRKATGDNKRPNKLSDVYGSQYITARATTVLTLWTSAVQNSLTAIPLKVRLSETPKPFYVFRDGKLNFTLQKTSGLFKGKQKVDADPSKDADVDVQTSPFTIS